jgi:hypothetical protein
MAAASERRSTGFVDFETDEEKKKRLLSDL